ncbi:MAG: GNAT family N-acetyltransferase [Pirellulaceae bacterium]
MKPSAADRLEVRPPRHEETAEIVRLLTDGESEMRRHLITSSVSGALNNPNAKTIGLVAANDKRVAGATIASAMPGGTGVLIGLRIDSKADLEVASLLYQALSRYLHALGVTFIQAICDPENTPREWRAIELNHLADLDYLSADTSAIRVSPTDAISFGPASELTDERLSALLSETYLGTLDCPIMNEYRNADETLASYRAAANYDVTAWRIAFHQGTPVGCVLTTPFPSSDAIEITYMGIVPEGRGHRWGLELVAETQRLAQARSLSSINLGVDRTNSPAIAIYRDCGFTKFFSEAVWGQRLT